jgi:ferredoxin-thioredoxin reductase catalytic chain
MSKKEHIALKKMYSSYAKKNGYKLQEDDKILNTIIDGLIRNMKKYKVRYCPCRIPSGDFEKDKDIICPCKFHKSEIEKDGFCHCRLFLAND